MNFGLKTRLQKITTIVLVMAMLITSFQIGDMVTYAYDEKTGMIAPADRSMVETKEKPSADAEKVSGLLYGKPVTVINETTDANGVKWYEVKYFVKDGAEEKQGFCQASNVLLDEKAFAIGTGKVNANNVSLWSSTGQYKAPKLATFNAGTKLEILDEHVDGSEKWYRIRCQVDTVNYIGWLESKYVTKDPIPEIEIDEEYEAYLLRIGFPQSYVKSLAILHAQYPNWIFEPVKTGLTWDEVISSESYAGRNLIYKTENDAKKSYASTEYNWYTNEWVIRDTSGWVSAHPDFIAYCMDPRNWFNTTNIFMYESLSYNPAHNAAGVTAILNGTFMTQDQDNGDGTMLNYANAFIDIGMSVNASPYHLASRVRQEQGVNGTSPMISGTYAGFEGFYNYFNIKTYGTGNEYIIRGLTYAKEQGWNTRYKALHGGAAYIARNYISVGQDTLYFQKFDVIAQGGLYNHQYMTNVQAAISESKNVAKAYADKTQAFVFKIPVYENMPKEPVQFTASGNRNNYLKSLDVAGHSLTPSFDGAKTSYSLIVGNDVTSVTVSATPVVDKASVEGTGTLSLREGTNTFSIICKSESGDRRTYTLTVIREGKEETPPSDNPGETPEVKPQPTYTSDKYKLGNYITGIAPQTKAADFLAGFKAEGCTLKVLTAAGAENTGAVATGNKLAVYVDGNLLESKEIVIYGDVNGDGKITMSDLLSINRHVIKTIPLKGIYLEAGDVNRKGDGATMSDLLAINRHVIGTIMIEQ